MRGHACLAGAGSLPWSTTVFMKIDLVGPARRGLAMGLNEAAGYGAVALTALATGAIAEQAGMRPAPFLLGLAYIGFAVGAIVAGVIADVAGFVAPSGWWGPSPPAPVSSSSSACARLVRCLDARPDIRLQALARATLEGDQLVVRHRLQTYPAGEPVVSACRQQARTAACRAR